MGLLETGPETAAFEDLRDRQACVDQISGATRRLGSVVPDQPRRGGESHVRLKAVLNPLASFEFAERAPEFLVVTSA